MPTPAHILKLREKIGHELLLAPGVCALVFNDRNEILLQLRSDFKVWAVIGGLMEPGEEPAATAVREVQEETGLLVEPIRISGVYITPELTYPNGDRMQGVITTFACRPISGEPRVNDDESLDVRYFPVNALPPDLRPAHRLRIEHALRNDPAAFFNQE